MISPETRRMFRISENIDRSDVAQLRDVLVALKETTLGQTHQMPQLLDDSHGDDHCLATLFPREFQLMVIKRLLNA